MQITVKKGVWTQITDSNAKLHVKVPYFSKVYYIESNDDPNETIPKPSDADEIFILITPNHAAGFLNLDYTNEGGGPLWFYSTNCDLYVIVK